jgi:NADPH:quinone reductase-like Zn-dependent oxidoreductase
MRQVPITRYGPPEVLVPQDAPDPVPRAGEARIRVRAAGVNFADVLARLGLYPDAPKPPVVVGYEVAGVVDAVGDGVTALAPGDRVIAITRFGGYADAVVTRATRIFRAPDGLSDAEGAAIPVTFLTAAIALYRMANVSAGETVLIHNAGGGVGIAAAQLARLRRARIIGTASASKHHALAAFGVEHALEYHDAEREVMRLTNGRGADVILDPLGAESFAASYRMLAPLGRLVMFGMSAVVRGERRSLWHAFRTWRALPRFKPFSLISHNRGVFGLNVGHLWTEERQLGGLTELLFDEFRAGRLRAIVAKTFPLERACDAHRFLQSRSNIGKVVLTT